MSSLAMLWPIYICPYLSETKIAPSLNLSGISYPLSGHQHYMTAAVQGLGKYR